MIIFNYSSRSSLFIGLLFLSFLLIKFDSRKWCVHGYISGPIASVLVTSFGYRYVAMSGAVVASWGFSSARGQRTYRQ